MRSIVRLYVKALPQGCWGLFLFVLPSIALAADMPRVAGIPIDFILFGATLVCVALFHDHTLRVGLTGLSVIVLYKLLFTGFKTGPGLSGLVLHFGHEWVTLANLLLLLVGFALLARHFEKTHIPVILPRYLPHDWKGGLALLALVFVLSSFLDNIAAALIGGAMAHSLFRAKVHIGYLAAIVAASNAGGAGSVVGDTTTTMMWIDGISPFTVVDAYVASVAALLVFGIPAARKQQAYSPILKGAHAHTHVDRSRVAIVAAILVAAIGTNITINSLIPEHADAFPYIGVAVWVALLASVRLRRPDWELVPEAAKGAIFLLSLVSCASMMPVEELPVASWQTALALGFVSSFFDNIPLTELALKQGGYDWGVLAYAVGFGGSMMWFGSSAGVALSNLFPDVRSVGRWVKEGWYVVVAYCVGFAALLTILGWHPEAPHARSSPAEMVQH